MPAVPERVFTDQPASKSSPSAFVLLSRRAQESGSSSRVLEARAAIPPLPPSLLLTNRALYRPLRRSLKRSSAQRLPRAPPPARHARILVVLRRPLILLSRRSWVPPPPPPPSQLPKRPVRSSRSDALKKDSVAEVPPEKTKRTRTAKHPRLNSKKIVECLQQEWSTRVAALLPLFAVLDLHPPLNAAQVNSLREEQEIQVRVSLLFLLKETYFLNVLLAYCLVRSVHRTGNRDLQVRGLRRAVRPLLP